MFKTRNLLVRLAAVGAVGAGLVVVNAAPAMAAVCPSGSPATPLVAGSLTNSGGVGVGVIHLFDGNCTYPHYDTVLAPNRNTRTALGWNEVSGVYIGSGFRATLSKGSYSATYTGPVTLGDPWRYGGDWSIAAFPA